MRLCGWLAILFLLAGPSARAASPWAEFEAPYAVHISADGATVDLLGSFSWAVPQTVSVALARAPNARVIRLDSPGGHVKAAMEVAALIRQRGLDTYVGRFCASACTVAFLAGRNRVITSDARIGFHQAHAPGIPPEQFDAPLRAIYARDGLPEAFIDHVLRTPPAQLWVPTHDQLRAARVITAEVPALVSVAP